MVEFVKLYLDYQLSSFSTLLVRWVYRLEYCTIYINLDVCWSHEFLPDFAVCLHHIWPMWVVRAVSLGSNNIFGGSGVYRGLQGCYGKVFKFQAKISFFIKNQI